MKNDEQAIRDLIAEWMRATAAGDVAKVLSLMDDDAVFLVTGQPPLRGRGAFASAFRAALEHVRIDGTSDIQGIQVTGDWAYCWNHLSVTITPLLGGPAHRRSGYTLSVLRKNSNGAWLLAQDANMLTVDPTVS